MSAARKRCEVLSAAPALSPSETTGGSLASGCASSPEVGALPIMRVNRTLRATLAHLHPSPTPAAAALPAVPPTSTPWHPVIDCPVQPRCHGPESDPPGADRVGLTPHEVEFFKANVRPPPTRPPRGPAYPCAYHSLWWQGYLVKRQLVPQRMLAPFVHCFWDEVVPPCVDRSDRATWIDPTTRHQSGWGPSPAHAAETASAGLVVRPWPVGYGENSIEWTEIGGRPDFVDATSAHPDVLRMVESLVGGPLKRPHRNRGAKVHFPRAEVNSASLGPHNDSAPFELFGIVYLSDVPPHSGGTTIWPASPHALWECLDCEHRHGFNPNERYQPTFDSILQNTQPVEFVGGAGDVMFLHPAMIVRDVAMFAALCQPTDRSCRTAFGRGQQRCARRGLAPHRDSDGVAGRPPAWQACPLVAAAGGQGGATCPPRWVLCTQR